MSKNINVLINIGPGAGGGRKRRGKKSILPNIFDDDCSSGVLIFSVIGHNTINICEIVQVFMVFPGILKSLSIMGRKFSFVYHRHICAL